MSVVVRMAPSPTGFLHVGVTRTFLFNWLFARQQGGRCLLRIENTDTAREVAEAVDQIQDSLSWLGIDWDGLSFQLDRMERCQQEARRLVEQGVAYEDEGAIRFRMPDEGTTTYHDLVLGEIETPNHVLDDLVLVRSDGRPTYNFASPVEDWLDGITHVIRGRDHISNTPRQINILRALGADIPQYAHLPDVAGDDGKKLSKRHGAQGVDEFRDLGYLPETMLNFLVLLGWSYDDRTTLMTREELVERFSFDRVGASSATFDYKKLDWMNGEYIRALPEDEFAHRLLLWLGEHGYEWDAELVRRATPLVQVKIKRLGDFPDYARFLFEEVDPDTAVLDPSFLAAAADALREVDEWRADPIESALRALADAVGLKPAKAFEPIRIAVTGSKVSPGLFESLELLGRDRSLARISRAAGGGAAAA